MIKLITCYICCTSTIKKNEVSNSDTKHRELTITKYRQLPTHVTQWNLWWKHERSQSSFNPQDVHIWYLSLIERKKLKVHAFWSNNLCRMITCAFPCNTFQKFCCMFTQNEIEYPLFLCRHNADTSFKQFYKFQLSWPNYMHFIPQRRKLFNKTQNLPLKNQKVYTVCT